MDEISMDIEKLLDAVHRSSEYQEYQKQAAELDKEPELKARVMRFRGDNFRLQNQADKDKLFQVAEQLNRESASLRQNLKVNAYLDAELAPVSYTHLDVYKRQECDFPRGPKRSPAPYTGRIRSIYFRRKCLLQS